MKKPLLIILLLISVVAGSLKAQVKSAAQGNIISVSDIHFNPFFDLTLINSLVTSPVANWEHIFASSQIQTPNTYGADSNYPLFISALKAMQAQKPNPEFMVITGDFLCHGFQSSYRKSGTSYPASMRDFSTKTIQFMALMLNKYFPKTVILPVLGNNDSYCGDYMIDPTGSFLKMFAEAFVPLQRNHNPTADAAFVAQFSKGGYYTFNLKDGSNNTLVMMNTIFYSVKYRDTCGTAIANPAGTELNWLTNVFAKAKASKSKLWLACHIPPGINAYSSANNCPATVTMWRDSCNKVYLGLIDTYQGIIKAGFAGHTHMDDFRVFYNSTGVPISMMHITPAISPLFNNNPGFQVMQYSKATFGLLNTQTYYLNVNHPNTYNWAFEYDYKKTYGVTSLGPAGLDAVRKKIAANPAYLNKYIGFYDMSNPLPGDNSITQQNWKAFWCTTGTETATAFTGCYCGGGNQ